MNILDANLYEGTCYRLADNWFSFIDVESYMDHPINYLEIGAHYGANVISVANTYASHPYSRLYAIDPWEDYDEYDEYVGKQKNIYDTYISNLERAGVKDKINTIRGYSHKETQTFPDAFFDIIYVDGNHDKDYVMEDAVNSFRKLKKGGFIIFDDYGWCDREDFKIGLDSFLVAYEDRTEVLGVLNSQKFVRKTR